MSYSLCLLEMVPVFFNTGIPQGSAFIMGFYSHHFPRLFTYPLNMLVSKLRIFMWFFEFCLLVLPPTLSSICRQWVWWWVAKSSIGIFYLFHWWECFEDCGRKLLFFPWLFTADTRFLKLCCKSCYNSYRYEQGMFSSAVAFYVKILSILIWGIILQTGSTTPRNETVYIQTTDF